MNTLYSLLLALAAGALLACLAGGAVSARETKFWRQSLQASGEAARRMGRGTLARVWPSCFATQ